APLSSTQLNATSTVVGNWSYNPTNGSVLNVGTNTLVGTFTPNDTANYTNATITNTVVVAKGSNNIIFGALPIKYVGDAAFNLTATASSGLTVTYTSSNTNVATVLGSLVTIMGEGTTTITANQAGDSNWNPATGVPQILRVVPAINRGLVAYYPFNGNANDESGNGNHGTVIGGTTLSADRFGNTNKAYLFNGTDGSIDVGNPVGNNPAELTQSCWVRILSREPGFDFDTLITKRHSDDGSDWPTLVIGSTAGTGRPIFLLDDAGYNQQAVASKPVELGAWAFVCGVKRGTVYELYVDGVLVASFNDARATGGSVYNMSFMRHGAWQNRHTHGVLDDVRIYNRALSAAEVEQLYYREAPPAVETFGNGTNGFSLEFVRVGNAGNIADTKGQPNPAGAVSYNYRMGKHEISREMITKANELGGLGITLADMSFAAEWGAMGPKRPATGVSYNEAARFVNWLNVSQGYRPAYKFSLQPGQAGYDANARPVAWNSADPGYDSANPWRNKDALFFLPSIDEWYKAAYFDPAINYYYEWPTGSDQGLAEAQSVGGGWTLPPGGTAPGTAVYYGHHGPADIESPYGTMAQGGNVFEWQENGMARGGSWSSFYFYGGWLALSSTQIPDPYQSQVLERESSELGFRVASSATLTNPTGIAPLITSTNSFSGKVGVAFSQTATANGDAPTVFSGTNLPGGLSITTNGLISGTPTTAGTFSSTLTASNLFGSTNQTATFTIAKGDQTITPPVLPPNIYPGG
ncbi:MAG: LamG domain-containing protein, partial [Verrucomicrobia bacterium]|nr:LamG domain-containing protein [Verrucomicrobiota bacterium]